MNEINIFEQASRRNLTFQAEKGVLHVSDLWNLTMSALDKIAVDLYRKLQEQSTISFIKAKADDTDHTELKFKIVKHIIDVRMAEASEKAQAQAKAAQNQRIAELIDRKENAALEALPLDELKAMLKS